MNEHSSIARPPKDRSWVLGYLSLFTSLSTLVCCALPSLLVLFGLGASVASMLSFMPWLVSLSHHKVLVFAVSGALILLSFVQNYAIAPRLRMRGGDVAIDACAPDDPACERASRFSRIILLISAGVYAVGFFAAFLLGPLLSWMDRS
jgi:mercuric ion transport protein